MLYGVDSRTPSLFPALRDTILVPVLAVATENASAKKKKPLAPSEGHSTCLWVARIHRKQHIKHLPCAALL